MPNVKETSGPVAAPNSPTPVGGIGYDTLPPLNPITREKEQRAGQMAQYQGPGNWWDQLAEKADWAYFESSPTAAAIRGYLQRNTAVSSKWTAEQLNDFYKDRGVTFADSEYPEVAALRIAQRDKEKRLNDYVSRGGSFGFGSELLAGSVQMADPANLALNYAGMRFLTPLIGKAGMSTFPSMFVENAITNLAADVPTYMQLKKEFTEQTFGEMAAGSLVGAGIAAGIGSFLHGRLSKTKAEPHVVADNISNHESGAKVDPNASQKFMGEERANGEVQPGNGIPKTGPAYEPVNHPSEVPFFVTKNGGALVSEGEHGKAVYASDSAYAANNKGHFAEVHVSPDAKILNLDLPLDNPDADVFKMAVEMKLDRFGTKPMQMQDGATLGDFLHRIELEEAAKDIPAGTTAKQIIQETAKELEYDGLASVHSVGGEPRFNKLTMFDAGKLTEAKFYQQNTALVPKPKSDDLSKLKSEYLARIQNKELYDPEMMSELEALKSKPETTAKEIKDFVKQQEQRILADLKKLTKKMPEAPTPQTRKVVGGTAGEAASINQPEAAQATKNVATSTERVVSDLTPEQLDQLKNHAMTDETRALVEEKLQQIQAEHALEVEKANAKKNFIDCLAQGIT